MPEGPEIHRAADQIAAAIAGERAQLVHFGLPRLHPWEAQLTGATVTAVEARGKAILTRFDLGYAVYSHNQLYGKWYVRGAGLYPKTGRSLRMEIQTERKSALLYSASEIEVLSPSEEEVHPYLVKLGPDAVDPRVRAEEVIAQMEDRRFSGRNLGALLLDQSFVSGLGNYLRSEILWWSGLHPSWRPKDLDPGDRADLARWILDVTRQSYRTGGITDCPARVAEAKAQGVPRRLYRHAAFAREGLPCPECGRKLEKIEVGSRRLYLCEGCQPAPRASAAGGA
ncbi:Endonuclease 8 [Planctomycetes bacterium Poly30]|uniref:DNA-(apurinic or apyrimidinic site) lyase n=1 Tax=Saltatorellus ferox TaxID=2528018 RepID=A0A518EZ57_9BACT|nr:Endonuclease 8 [Planctomycetes bacterium Poly30]